MWPNRFAVSIAAATCLSTAGHVCLFCSGLKLFNRLAQSFGLLTAKKMNIPRS